MKESLLEQAVVAAGLEAVLRDVTEGKLPADGERDKLEKADVLLIGALADRLRLAALGSDVRVYSSLPAGCDTTNVMWISNAQLSGTSPLGIATLKHAALLRLRTSLTTHLGVDWNQIGAELAQVLLGFGVSAVKISSSKLALVEKASSRPHDEISALIERAGRNPIWMNEQGNANDVVRDNYRESSRS